jgi:hypothetical protein
LFYSCDLNASAFEQSLGIGIGSPEFPVKGHRVVGAASLKNVLSESCGRFLVKKAVFDKSLKSIRVQYFGPEIGIITGVVIVVEYVIEIKIKDLIIG